MKEKNIEKFKKTLATDDSKLKKLDVDSKPKLPGKIADAEKAIKDAEKKIEELKRDQGRIDVISEDQYNLIDKTIFEIKLMIAEAENRFNIRLAN